MIEAILAALERLGYWTSINDQRLAEVERRLAALENDQAKPATSGVEWNCFEVEQ